VEQCNGAPVHARVLLILTLTLSVKASSIGAFMGHDGGGGPIGENKIKNILCLQ